MLNDVFPMAVGPTIESKYLVLFVVVIAFGFRNLLFYL